MSSHFIIYSKISVVNFPITWSFFLIFDSLECINFPILYPAVNKNKWLNFITMVLLTLYFFLLWEKNSWISQGSFTHNHGMTKALIQFLAHKTKDNQQKKWCLLCVESASSTIVPDVSDNLIYSSSDIVICNLFDPHTVMVHSSVYKNFIRKAVNLLLLSEIIWHVGILINVFLVCHTLNIN